MAQVKDFVSKYCSQTQLNKELVSTVTDAFIGWIHDTMLVGEEIRLPGVGKFKIQANSYSQSGLMKNGASLHYHEFRPSFRFCVPFRKECDTMADSIRVGVNNREERKEVKRQAKRAKKGERPTQTLPEGEGLG